MEDKTRNMVPVKFENNPRIGGNPAILQWLKKLNIQIWGITKEKVEGGRRLAGLARKRHWNGEA